MRPDKDFLIFEDYDLEIVMNGALKRNYIEFYRTSKKILKFILNEGLLAVRMVCNEDLKKKDAILKLYSAIRPFEEIDYEHGNKIMKKFADDDLIQKAYYDMCKIIHGKGKEQKNNAVCDMPEIKFETKMTIEGALFLLIALARSDYALGKKVVKKSMKRNKIPFKDYGRKKSLNKYLKKCKDSKKPPLTHIDDCIDDKQNQEDFVWQERLNLD